MHINESGVHTQYITDPTKDATVVRDFAVLSGLGWLIRWASFGTPFPNSQPPTHDLRPSICQAVEGPEGVILWCTSSRELLHNQGIDLPYEGWIYPMTLL